MLAITPTRLGPGARFGTRVSSYTGTKDGLTTPSRKRLAEDSNLALLPQQGSTLTRRDRQTTGICSAPRVARTVRRQHGRSIVHDHSIRATVTTLSGAQRNLPTGGVERSKVPSAGFEPATGGSTGRSHSQVSSTGQKTGLGFEPRSLWICSPPRNQLCHPVRSLPRDSNSRTPDYKSGACTGPMLGRHRESWKQELNLRHPSYQDGALPG